MAKRKYQEDYNLKDEADRLKYVKAINNRIRNVANIYGVDSVQYERVIEDIQTFVQDDDMIRKNRDGVMQLSEGKQYLNNLNNFVILERKKYLDKPTVSEEIKLTFEKMKERGELDNDLKLNQQLYGPPTKDGVYPTVKAQVIKYSKEIAQISKDIEDDIGYLYSMPTDDLETQLALQTLQLTGRRKTYEELELIRKATSRARNQVAWSVDDF